MEAIFGHIQTWIELVITAVIAVTSGILGIRMRRRIRRALDTKVESELELTSLNTWMRVEEEEVRKKQTQNKM